MITGLISPFGICSSETFQTLKRFFFTAVVFSFVMLATGCKFTINVIGEGTVVADYDVGDYLGKPSFSSCTDFCEDTSMGGELYLTAIPAEGYTFLGYAFDGVSTTELSDRYASRSLFGTVFSFQGLVDTNVTAVFHPTDDILDFKESAWLGKGYSCIVSKSQGLQCWHITPYEKVAIDNSKVPQGAQFSEILSLGGAHICAIDNHELNCWGGKTPDLSQIINPSKVSSGGKESCAIGDNGVFCWDKSGFNNNVPSNIVNPREIKVQNEVACAVADSGVHCWQGDDSIHLENVSAPHGLALNLFTRSLSGCVLDGGGVRCWGNQADLENNQPQNLSNPSKLAIAGSHACVIDDNGVQCWGDSETYSRVPELSHPKKIEFVDQLDLLACALDDHGTTCWGRGYTGQVKETPNNLVNPTQVAAGTYHTCALGDNGVSCWGGENEATVTVPELNYPTAISADRERSCALDDDRVVCWGRRGTTERDGFNNLTLMDGSEYGVCAVDDDGLHCWDNPYYDDYDLDISNIVKLAVEGRFVCVITENALPEGNKLSCWTHENEAPLEQDLLIGDRFPEGWNTQISNPQDVVAGVSNVCVFGENASQCFGYQGDYEEPYPTQAQSVSFGFDYHCFIESDGVSCSGRGPAYKETYYDRQQSAAPDWLSGETHSLTSGWYHSCAIDQGEVVCWGEGPVVKLY